MIMSLLGWLWPPLGYWEHAAADSERVYEARMRQLDADKAKRDRLVAEFEANTRRLIGRNQ